MWNEAAPLKRSSANGRAVASPSRTSTLVPARRPANDDGQGGIELDRGEVGGTGGQHVGREARTRPDLEHVVAQLHAAQGLGQDHVVDERRASPRRRACS